MSQAYLVSDVHNQNIVFRGTFQHLSNCLGLHISDVGHCNQLNTFNQCFTLERKAGSHVTCSVPAAVRHRYSRLVDCLQIAYRLFVNQKAHVNLHSTAPSVENTITCYNSVLRFSKVSPGYSPHFNFPQSWHGLWSTSCPAQLFLQVA